MISGKNTILRVGQQGYTWLLAHSESAARFDRARAYLDIGSIPGIRERSIRRLAAWAIKVKAAGKYADEMRRVGSSRPRVFVALISLFRGLGFTHEATYFFDEMEDTTPIKTGTGKTGREEKEEGINPEVVRFAKNKSSRFQYENGRLFMKISISLDETYLIVMKGEMLLPGGIELLKEIYEMARQGAEEKIAGIMTENRASAREKRNALLLRINHALDQQLSGPAGEAETRAIIFRTTIEYLPKIFPRLARASIALWDEREGRLVVANTHNVEAQYAIAPDAFSFAKKVLLEFRQPFWRGLLLERPSVGQEVVFSRPGDCAVFPFYADASQRTPLGVISISTEARCHLEPDDLVAFELLVAAIAAKVKIQQLIAAKDWAKDHDPLTDLPNRRLCEATYETALGQQQRASIGIGMLDLDHFKRVNDEEGHVAGDQVLMQAAVLMDQAMKDIPTILNDPSLPQGFVARVGGEEFMMLMPGLNARQTGQVLGELRKRMEAHAFRVEMVGGQEKTLRKTASIGMTIIDPSTKPSFTNIYRIVDRALYFAKGKILGTDTDDPNGRNRVAECYDINKSPQLVVT